MAMGQLIATSNLEIADQAARQGFKLLFVGDMMDVPKQTGFINASCLTPDYKTMSAIIEGDEAKYMALYQQYLSLPHSEEMIAVLISALFRGNNVLMFFPEESIALSYPYALLTYLQNRFGLMVGDKSKPFSYNPNYNMSNMRLLYLYNLIDWKTYINTVEDLDQYVLAKMRQELCPIYGLDGNISDPDLVQFVTKIKEDMKKPRLFERAE